MVVLVDFRLCVCMKKLKKVVWTSLWFRNKESDNKNKDYVFKYSIPEFQLDKIVKQKKQKLSRHAEIVWT